MSSYESIVLPVLAVLGRWRPPRWLSLALAATIFAAAAYVVHRELAAMSPTDFRAAFAGLHPFSVSLALGLAVASFVCLIANEDLALRALSPKAASLLLVARTASPLMRFPTPSDCPSQPRQRSALDFIGAG